MGYDGDRKEQRDGQGEATEGEESRVIQEAEPGERKGRAGGAGERVPERWVRGGKGKGLARKEVGGRGRMWREACAGMVSGR